MNLFTEWMEKLFNKTTKDVIICGDYNIDLLNPKKSQSNRRIH